MLSSSVVYFLGKAIWEGVDSANVALKKTRHKIDEVEGSLACPGALKNKEVGECKYWISMWNQKTLKGLVPQEGSEYHSTH